MIGIYRITNLINNKFYIGQSVDVEYRIKQHNYEAHDPKNLAYNSPLHKDMREFGWDNFSKEVLLECKAEDLSLREQELIAAAEILSPSLLYNTRNDYISSKIGQYTLEGKLIKIWNSTRELRDAGFVEIGNITRVCRGAGKTSVGFIWRFVENEEDAKEKEEEVNSSLVDTVGIRRKIVQYNLETGEFINIFKSGRAASLALNKPSGVSPILNTCKGKQRQAYGYGWVYEEDFEKISEKFSQKN